MKIEEAKKMLKAKLECLKNETSGINYDCNMRLCDGCSLNYEQGNMGEQKEALEMAIKALEEEPQEDCISRRDVLALIEYAYETCKIGYTDYIELYDAVKDTLSVKPQRAKGHLVSNQQGGEVKPFWERYRCSVCGEYAQDNFNYCSRCGAELEGEEE